MLTFFGNCAYGAGPNDNVTRASTTEPELESALDQYQLSQKIAPLPFQAHGSQSEINHQSCNSRYFTRILVARADGAETKLTLPGRLKLQTIVHGGGVLR